MNASRPPALVPVILSGGAGSRLWPASRTALPKPFLPLPDGQTLALKTLIRAARVGDGPALTVTGALHHALTEATARRPDAPRLEMHYLLEPVGRNTAPAIAAAARYAAERWGPDTLLLVMPSDHLIEDSAAFEAAVAHAAELAREDCLVTFGITPAYPETGYGYLRRGPPLGAHGFRVARFVEKPDAERARAFVADGRHDWNAGIFCFRAGRFLDELAEHAPAMAAAVAACWDASRGRTRPAATGSASTVVELDAATFAAVPAESVDYAVMERSTRSAVVPCRIGWSDVGSWAAVRELYEPDADGNRLVGAVEADDAENCFVLAGERLVGLVGARDLVVVDAPDALLIAAADRTQGVKAIVGRLKRRGGHPTLHEPAVQNQDWGTLRVIDRGEFGTVRRLDVRPGAELRLEGRHSLTVLAGELCRANRHTDPPATVGQSLSIGAGARLRAGPAGATVLQFVR